MCGRFTLTRKNLEQLAASLDAEVLADGAPLYRPRYNIAPTDPHWILRSKREQRQLLVAKWGLVNSWQTDAKSAFKQINARSESAPSRPAFRDAYVHRRCAVPADGFFEWTGTKEARRPIWFHGPHDDLLLFAGLYESWRDPKTDAWQRTFTILTTDANETVAPVHDRMPVILPPERIDEWLFVPPREPEQESYAEILRGVLVPADAGVLVATEVSRRVNSVQNDDEACLAPANDAETVESPRLL
jgi:putative SOS response-associated peptidase YedK